MVNSFRRDPESDARVDYCTTVADREADIYDFLATERPENSQLLIRAYHNRQVKNSDGTLEVERLQNAIAATLTCFNRKQKTLACLEYLFKQVLPADVDILAYLVDDASTDGTRDAVRQAYTSSQDFFQRWEPILERGNVWGFQRSNER